MGKGPRFLPFASGIDSPRHAYVLIKTNVSQSMYLDKSLPLEVRYLAIIQLKNGIDKYWRKTATKYASKANSHTRHMLI